MQSLLWLCFGQAVVHRTCNIESFVYDNMLRGLPWKLSWLKNLPARQETPVQSRGEGNGLPTLVFLDFPGGSDSKESACNAEDLGSIPELGRLPGGGHGNPLQYSSLENPHGQRSLSGYSLWGHKESNMTERLSTYIYTYS